MALGAGVLAHNTAGETIRNPGQDKQGNNSPATPSRAQKFTSASSLSIAFSSSDSARGLLSGCGSFFQLGKTLGLLSLHTAIKVAPAVIDGLRHLLFSAEVDNGRAQGGQLLSGFELADNLLGFVAGSFHGGLAGSGWPDEDSHSPWTVLGEPRQVTKPKNKKRSYKS